MWSPFHSFYVIPFVQIEKAIHNAMTEDLRLLPAAFILNRAPTLIMRSAHIPIMYTSPNHKP